MGLCASTVGGLSIFLTLENILENIDIDVLSCPSNKMNKHTRITVGRLYCPQIAVTLFHINICESIF